MYKRQPPIPSGSAEDDKAAAEKIRSMEATVSELQKRAGDLTQKIDDASSSMPAGSSPAVTTPQPVAPAVQPPPAKPASAGSDSSGSGDVYKRQATHVAVLAEQRIVEFGPQEKIMAGDHPLVAAFRGGK